MQYRGKHIHVLPGNSHLNGTWVVGYLSSEDYISVTYDDGTYAEKLIDKNTIGLCSDKRDITGKDIFQGDVMENENGTRFEVRYGKFAMYCPVDDCMMENIGFFAVAEGYYEDMPLGPTEEYATVIGNIHDNPELKVNDKYRCSAELNMRVESEDISVNDKEYNYDRRAMIDAVMKGNKVVILDPEEEYKNLAQEMGGEAIFLDSTNSENKVFNSLE